jgi:hypothetical protein
MRAIVEDDVVPITDVAAGDSELWTILQRGLQKDPAARWSSALELGRALAEWLLRHDVDVDITGERLGAWLQPESSKRRDLLSEPPPARSARDSGRRMPAITAPAPPTSLIPSSQSTVATVIRPRRSLRASVIFIATLALVLFGATFAISIASRRHASVIGSSPTPLPEMTATAAFEPTAPPVSALPREPASAAAPIEAPDPSSIDRGTKPKPAVPGAPAYKRTKPVVKEAPRSDLKDPY